MHYTTVVIDCESITDFASFHHTFKSVFGFPEFYGHTMDGWIDCMSSLDNPSDGLTTVHALPNGVVNLQLDNIGDFSRRCPDLYSALLECSAFVNWRRTEAGEPPVLCLSFNA